MENRNRETNEVIGITKGLGLYIHIPFCVRKCAYCDFLSAPGTEAMKKDYVEALIREIDSYQGRISEYTVQTLFIGGGTPSCMPEADIVRIMAAVRRVFHIEEDRLEATIEINPGTVNEEKLISYQKAGINRISFGLQSTDNSELKRLGRIHLYEEFLQNYKLAREVGFLNINVDLMSALPGQTLASWEKTLREVAALEPEHISAYSLIIEEGTEFYDRYRPGAPFEGELPDEDTDRRIYYRTKEMLESYGYHRYEISNYAKDNYECRHNNSYWIGTDYLGLGLGAASLINGARFSNMHDIKQYINRMNQFKAVPVLMREEKRKSSEYPTIEEDLLGIRTDFQRLSREEQMEEFMFLGLRRCVGIRKDAFFKRFGVSVTAVYGKVLEKLEQKKLIEQSEEWLRLTEYGIDISNEVLSYFLFD
jgi:oxygen-independent coproporphyrinogen III oxidase